MNVCTLMLITNSVTTIHQCYIYQRGCIISAIPHCDMYECTHTASLTFTDVIVVHCAYVQMSFTVRMYKCRSLCVCTNVVHCAYVQMSFTVRMYKCRSLCLCTNVIHCAYVQMSFTVRMYKWHSLCICTNVIHCAYVQMHVPR